MAQIYTFNTSLLSAAKELTPTANALLSANGVNVLTLSAVTLGILFNRNATPSGVVIPTTVEGNTFSIDRIYDGTQMALINASRLYTIFQFASAGSAGSAAVALSTNYTDVSTPGRRRKRYLGYNS